jgi:hypothetical protein
MKLLRPEPGEKREPRQLCFRVFRVFRGDPLQIFAPLALFGGSSSWPVACGFFHGFSHIFMALSLGLAWIGLD